MRIGVFSDVYYSEGDQKAVKDGMTPAQKLKKVMAAFSKAKVDACFCMGNLVRQQGVDRAHVLKSFESAMQTIGLYSIPCYYVPAPQDFIQTSPKDLAQLVDLYQLPYAIHADGYSFIVLDGSYTTDLIHCEGTTAQQPQYRLPREQITFMSRRYSNDKRVILTYLNMDSRSPAQFRLQNADEAREAINAMRSPRIVIQAACPYELDEIENGVRYINVPSMRHSATELYRIIEL